MTALGSTSYPARPVKRRRSTQVEMTARRDALYEIVAEQKPMTVRQVFYQATVHGLVEKAETGYDKVCRDLAEMRRDDWLPYDWLADNTRWQRRPWSHRSPAAAIEAAAALYRRDLWADAECYVEVWLEKDALAGVLYPITAANDVPLMVSRGYSSLSFLHSAAEHLRNLEVPAFIYHLGDRDPSGVNAAEKIEQTLREMAPETWIRFERLAVLPWQVEQWSLPSRPTKTTDSRAKRFGDEDSVELDAIPPMTLRRLLQDGIEQHLPPARLAVLKAAEEDERRMIRGLVGMLPDLTE